MLLNEAKFSGDSSVKSQPDIAIIINIGGRYALSDRRNSNGERRVFACRAVNASPRSIAIACPVYGKVGDRVMAQIDHLGKLEGIITRVLAQGFVMAIAASEQDRERLAAKIKWLESYKNHDTHDRRGDERIAPANPMSKLILADGRVETAWSSIFRSPAPRYRRKRFPMSGQFWPSGASWAKWCGTLSADLPCNSSSARARTASSAW